MDNDHDPLEKIRDRLPLRYQNSHDPVGLWYSFYYKVCGDFYLLPGMRTMDVKELVRLFRERLSIPHELRALRYGREVADHIRACIEAFDMAGDLGFINAWNRGDYLFPDQTEPLTLYRSNPEFALDITKNIAGNVIFKRIEE